MTDPKGETYGLHLTFSFHIIVANQLFNLTTKNLIQRFKPHIRKFVEEKFPEFIYLH